jgi:hypothetical protein
LADDPLNPTSRENRELTGDEARLLKQLSTDGVEIALHGFTHRTRNLKFRSELIGLSESELRRWLEQSFQTFKKLGLPDPIAFIPPFNTLESTTVRVLGDYTPILCGGPESIQCLGFCKCPSHLGGLSYWPSYFPAYGRARDLATYAHRLLNQNKSCHVPLTLHWRWEIKNNFEDVNQLAALLDGKVDRWSQMVYLRGQPSD